MGPQKKFAAKIEKLLQTAVSRKAAKYVKKDNDRGMSQYLNMKFLCQVLVFHSVFTAKNSLKFILTLRLCGFARKWFFRYG
jgi:hypothetical protein